MTRSRPTDHFGMHARGGTYLWAGLFLIFFLACCGQTAETGDPQSGQTAAQPQGKSANQSTMPQPEGRQLPYKPDEVLVKFWPEADAKTIAHIQTELKLETIHKFSSPNLFLMKITDGATVEATIKRLNELEAVKYAEPNYKVKTTQ